MSKNKIDVTLKDLEGFTALHYLANNNLTEIAKEAVKTKKQDKERARYIYRKGKKINVRRHNYYGLRGNNQMNIDGYFDDEIIQVEFQIRLKELETIQLKCAELLIKAGISVKDQVRESKATPLFIACSN